MAMLQTNLPSSHRRRRGRWAKSERGKAMAHVTLAPTVDAGRSSAERQTYNVITRLNMKGLNGAAHFAPTSTAAKMRPSGTLGENTKRKLKVPSWNRFRHLRRENRPCLTHHHHRRRARLRMQQRKIGKNVNNHTG